MFLFFFHVVVFLLFLAFPVGGAVWLFCQAGGGPYGLLSVFWRLFWCIRTVFRYIYIVYHSKKKTVYPRQQQFRFLFTSGVVQ